MSVVDGYVWPSDVAEAFRILWVHKIIRTTIECDRFLILLAHCLIEPARFSETDNKVDYRLTGAGETVAKSRFDSAL